MRPTTTYIVCWSDWGEGTSDASVFGQGQGIAATEGDATWFHTFNPGEEWSTPGGDFEESPSATASVGIEDSYAWSSDELIQGRAGVADDAGRKLWLDHDWRRIRVAYGAPIQQPHEP